MGTRLLEDRETPGQYVIEADFGVIDPMNSIREDPLNRRLDLGRADDESE